MPSSIFFSGRLISVPGAYSKVDASGLEQIGLNATGIVAVVGEAVGGIPASAITTLDDYIQVSKPETARSIFRSGPLREVADMLFAPSNDADIPGGAVKVIAMKVNPATQSSATLANSYADSLTLTSEDYGAFTSQINISIADGTNQGKLVTITFEDSVEAGDDIGGDVMFKIKYVKPTGGWDTMTAEVASDGDIVCDATRDVAGLDSEITAQPASASVMTVVSSNAADTTQQIIIYGLDGTGAAVSESITLTGTTSKDGSQSFAKVLGARIVGTTLGTVTVSDDDPATILTIAAGANGSAGLASAAAMYVSNSAITVVADGTTTKNAMIIGVNATGAVQLEKFVLTGTTAVVGTASFSEISYIAVGEVEAARTLTWSAEAARADSTVQTNLQKAADFFNAKYDAVAVGGFVFTLETGLTTLLLSDLDVTTGAGGAVSCLSPTEPSFYADLYAIITWINTNSSLVTAAKASGALGGAPSNTTSDVFLSGGVEGTSTFTDWQNALNKLKDIYVNSIVVLTGDPAVHAALSSHCNYMCGIGRKERDGFVGLMNTALTDVPTKTEAKSQIIDLNTRHIRAFAQAIERYNTDGDREEFPTYYHAAIAAGMQAGSPIGTSLTFKYENILNFRQDSTWNPIDDAEEMIQAGLCFCEYVDGVGRRIVRNITTHLSSNNIAFSEGSVNEAVNYACYTLRTNLERAVGKQGFAGTINATKGEAIGTLGLLKDENIIIASRSLAVDLAVDVLEVSVEIAPIIPINFVPTTIHLVTVAQTAA